MLGGAARSPAVPAPVAASLASIVSAVSMANETATTRCCLPSLPCGELRCHELTRAACLALARARSPLQVDTLQCARAAQRLPGWQDVVAPFVIAPLAVVFGASCLFGLLGTIYDTLGLRHSRFVIGFIGTCDQPSPIHPQFQRIVAGVQLALSTAVMLAFIVCSYLRAVPAAVHSVESVMGIFFVFHFFVRAFSLEFRLGALGTVASVVDVLTVPAMLAPSLLSGAAWLSLNFLRSLHVLKSYEQLSGFDTDAGIRKGLVSMILSFVTLIVCFAGSILVLEVLGEVPAFQNLEMRTEMGDISFFTMIYWIVETITTVGYGDYHPTTWLARLVTTCLMVTGFAFLGVEMERIFSIMSRNKKFAGAYVKTSRSHVVLVGGGVQQTDELLLVAFLEEMFHESYRSQWPDLVLMASEVSMVERAKDIFEQHLQWQARLHVFYLAGSPLSEQDLRRAHVDTASMVFVISDTTGKKDSAEDDKENLMRALSVRHTFPLTPLRVMLLLQASREMAFGVGIPPRFCFAMNEMKDNLFWQSCRCKGWNTLLCNLMVTTGDGDDGDSGEYNEPWLNEYVFGMGYEVYGFLPKPCFFGSSLRDLILEAYRVSGVLVLAVQLHGRIRPAPLRTTCYIRQDTVLFCLAQDESDLRELAVDPEELDWRQVFEKNRRVVDSVSNKDHFLQNIVRSTILSDLSGIGTSSMQVNHRDSCSLPTAALLADVEDDEEPAREDEEEDADAGGGVGGGRSSISFGPPEDEDSDDVLPATLGPLLGQSQGSGSEDAQDRSSGRRQGSITRAATMASMSSAGSLGWQSGEADSAEILVLNDAAMSIIEKAEESPFVLLIDQSQSWQTVVPFLLQSRRDYMPFTMPIVVLSEKAPPPPIADFLSFEEDGLTGVIIGSSNRAADLLDAGVKQCSIIVCLGQDASYAAQPSREMVAMLDADVLMLHRMLTSLGLASKAMIFEFKRTANMRLLPQLEMPTSCPIRRTAVEEVNWAEEAKHGRNARSFFVDEGEESTSGQEQKSCWPWPIELLLGACGGLFGHTLGRSRSGSGDRTLGGRYSRAESSFSGENPSTMKQDDSDSATREDIAWNLDPRFAAGEVFSPHFLGALMAHAFYTPGVLEVMQALLIPTEDEDAFLPWQIHLHEEHVGMSYGQLFRELVSHSEHPILPLGMLRVNNGVKPYVVTNPTDDTRLTDTDMIFVLGDRHFGEVAYSDGILPLSGRPSGTEKSRRFTLAWDGTTTEDQSQKVQRRWKR